MSDATIRRILRAELDGLTPLRLRQRLEFERSQTGYIIGDASDGSLGPTDAQAQLDSNAVDIARIRAAMRRRSMAA